MAKTLDELHKIREQIYQEEKNLPREEVLKKLHERVDEILEKRNLHLKRIERKPVTV